MGTTMSSKSSSYKYYDKSIYSSKGPSKNPYSTQFSKEYWTVNKEDKSRNSIVSDRFGYQKQKYKNESDNKFVSAFCDQVNTSTSTSYNTCINRSTSSTVSSALKPNHYNTFS
uniref:Ovule protein n=1 Tax=Strongyloides stercoralis TaxID=6248 RepID=A0A0K0E207_STRER